MTNICWHKIRLHNILEDIYFLSLNFLYFTKPLARSWFDNEINILILVKIENRICVNNFVL